MGHELITLTAKRNAEKFNIPEDENKKNMHGLLIVGRIPNELFDLRRLPLEQLGPDHQLDPVEAVPGRDSPDEEVHPSDGAAFRALEVSLLRGGQIAHDLLPGFAGRVRVQKLSGQFGEIFELGGEEKKIVIISKISKQMKCNYPYSAALFRVWEAGSLVGRGEKIILSNHLSCLKAVFECIFALNIFFVYFQHPYRFTS